MACAVGALVIAAFALDGARSVLAQEPPARDSRFRAQPIAPSALHAARSTRWLLAAPGGLRDGRPRRIGVPPTA
jgi:hypothetical protein